MIDELDSAVITLVSHNQVDELVHNGVQIEWVNNPDAKVIYRIGLEQKHGAKKMIPNRINLLTAAWGELQDPKQVKHLVSLNGTGDDSATIVADKLLNRYLSTNAKQTVSKLTDLLQRKPHEARQFLPLIALELEKLSTSGQAYDPRPSAHKGSIVPPILFKSRLNTYNQIFGGKANDGGGYRKGWWAVWMGATGRGKCLGLGTPVLMFDGSVKNVEDVITGDWVMGPDSKPRTVLGTTTGIAPLYRITPVKGNSYVVNESHILSLKMSGKTMRKRCGDIVNINIKDYFSQSNEFRHCAKGYRIGVEFQPADVFLDPYFLGIWLGDGTSAKENVTTMEPEVVDYLSEFADGYGLSLKVRSITGKAKTYGISGGHAGGISNPIRSALRSLNVLGNKHIPNEYKVNSREVRLQILAGLIDSDGFLAANAYDYITKSEALADDICFLARSLGLAAYKKPCKKSCPTTDGKIFTGDYFRLNISGDVDMIPCRVARRKAKPRQQIKSTLVTGITVTPIGDGQYAGFELDGDGLFLLGDFTVTHNTAQAYTMSVDAILQDKKVVFISKERQEQVSARILLGLTGLTLDEIGLEKGMEQTPLLDENGDHVLIRDRAGNEIGPWHDAAVRQKILTHFSEKVERLLKLYDWSFSTHRQVKAIISAEQPTMVNGDFYDVTDVVGNDKAVGLGIISRENEKIAHETGVHFNGFFQIAGHEKAAYEKHDSHEILGPFGSTMATQFADTVLQTKWWGQKPNHQHTRRNKCRLGGLNDSWIMQYLTQNWIFSDSPIIVPQSY